MKTWLYLYLKAENKKIITKYLIKFDKEIDGYFPSVCKTDFVYI